MSTKQPTAFSAQLVLSVGKLSKYRFPNDPSEAHMARKNHRGAYRTAIAYVLIVMGGTFLLVLPAFTLLASVQEKSYAAYHHLAQPSVVPILGFHLKLFLRLAASFLVLLWLFAGVLIYGCGLALQKLKVPLLARLILAAISACLSYIIIFLLAPTGWSSLASVLFTMFGVGLLGAAFGFFVYPRICEDSFQIAPLGRGPKIVVGAWALLFVYAWGGTAYVFLKIKSTRDPQVELVFAKWKPGEGEVQEERNKAINDPSFHCLRDLEVEELRAAGLTGTLHGYGCSALGQGKRLVVVMARPVRETFDLPKPASGDVLYLQTQEGWRAFPPSAPTVPRTLRLAFLDPTPTNNVATTNYSLDIGLGHAREPAFAYAFSWVPDEFQAPVPSLPNQPAPTN